MTLVLLKLGGSVLTLKGEKKPAFDMKNVSRISAEVAAAVKTKVFDLVIVHGAGSFGHPIAAKYRLADGLSDAVALARCQSQMNALNSLVCKELAGKGVAAFPFQVSATSVSEGRVLKSLNAELLQKLLKQGITPVLFGTPVYDERQGCSIISGDQIIAKLALLLQPGKIIFATNVDGIYDKNPASKDAKLLKSLTARQLRRIEAGASGSVDVTGGMDGKLKWIAEISNVKVQIVNGNKSGNIRKVLLGDERVGTVIQL